MKEKTEKKQAPKKAPRPPAQFRKPLKSKIFEKRFLKYLEHPDDRKFFAACFTQQEDVYVLREKLTKNDITRLKKILAIIKINRKGPVNFIPLAFAGIVAAAVIVFVTIFANPLISRAMEKGLEAIFEAKANVYNLRLNIFRFNISMNRITVADRDKPMTNLFDMGRTIISLNSAAVLRGKIYINEIAAETIRFGTPRTVSGAIPAKPQKVKPEKPESDAPPLIDLKNFDAMALLNAEFEKLKTPKLYDDAINAYNTTYAKYNNQVELAKTRSEELKSQAQPLLALNVNSYNFRDPAVVTQVRQTIQDINTLVSTVQTTADDATNLVKGLEDDINLAKGLEQNARTAITDDINHLKSYIDLGSGAAFAVLEPVIRDILSDAGEQYLDYGIRALEILEQLKANQMVQSALASAKAPPKSKEKKPKKEVFKGRDVPFPVKAYPKFYLGRLASDFTLDSWNWAFELKNVNSHPDLVQINPATRELEPAVTLAFGLTEEDGSLHRQVSFNGSADFRTDPVERFNAVVNGNGFPVKLDGAELSKVGINGFNGVSTFSVNLSGRTDGGASGGGTVQISQAQLVNPAGTLAEAIDTAVREAGQVNLGIQYTHWTDRSDEFKISTNIADLITRALRAAASAYTQKAMDEVEKVLRAKINEYIGDRFASREDVDALFRLARGDKAAVDQLKNSLNAKKDEFEQKIKGAAEQAVQQVKEEVKEQGQQAVQDIKEGKTPTIQTPTLPSTGGIKLPGR